MTLRVDTPCQISSILWSTKHPPVSRCVSESYSFEDGWNRLSWCHWSYVMNMRHVVSESHTNDSRLRGDHWLKSDSQWGPCALHRDIPNGSYAKLRHALWRQKLASFRGHVWQDALRSTFKQWWEGPFARLGWQISRGFSSQKQRCSGALSQKLPWTSSGGGTGDFLLWDRGAKASGLLEGIRASAQVEFCSQLGANVRCPEIVTMNFVQETLPNLITRPLLLVTRVSPPWNVQTVVCLSPNFLLVQRNHSNLPLLSPLFFFWSIFSLSLSLSLFSLPLLFYYPVPRLPHRKHIQ